MNKKAAMEMSVGTIVTIVLLVTVLILGLVLVRQIFGSGKDSIDQIDQAIQSEITKLFADENKKVVIYPASREISVKKGDSGGFGFSIKNVDSMSGVFSYKVSPIEVSNSCQLTLEQAGSLIALGGSGDNINIPSGSVLENAILVKFEIPETAPLCKIRYGLDIKKDSQQYESTIGIDLNIK